jgi:hypothetical protein
MLPFGALTTGEAEKQQSLFIIHISDINAVTYGHKYMIVFTPIHNEHAVKANG